MKVLPPVKSKSLILFFAILCFGNFPLLECNAQNAPVQPNQVDPKSAARFESYDKNKDQLISLDEFLEGHFAEKGDNRRALEGKFESIDRDRDNKLSLNEYAGAKQRRDGERIERGKMTPPEESKRRKEKPLFTTTPGKNGSLAGTWNSPLLGKPLPCTVRYPFIAAEKYPVVVYLKGLRVRRLGTLSDKTLISGFLNEGMIVIEVDYGKDSKAVTPGLLPEIDQWYGFLHETQEYPVDNSWIYVLPAGHTIDRKVRICEVGGTTVDMDVIYPSGDAGPVPLMLQITSIKDTGFWINQRAYYIYGLLINGYAGAIMEHNGGTRFAPKGELFPEKRAARLLRAEAAKWNLSGQLAVTGHSKGSSRAAKAAFLNDGEREGDPGPHPDQSDRFQAVLLSAGQHAIEYLIEDGFLDEVGEAKREAARKQFESMTLEEMQEISTTTYVTPDDPPAFLCVGELDKRFRVAQMRRLAEKCREVGLTHRFVVQPEMPHQYIDDPAVIGKIFRFLDRYLK